MSSEAGRGSLLSAIAQRSCAWCERWFPDAFAFAVLAVAVVALAAVSIGAAPLAVAESFGAGFWGLIPFTMQMTFIIIGGYVTADSPVVARLVVSLASLPRSGRGAVAMVAVFAAVMSLVHWGLSLVFSSLLVRALARRSELSLDYRAAAAGACTGLGSVWALGLSSSAAQLEANPASMPPALLAETGIIPFGQTIFLWQSMLCALILVLVSTWVAWKTAPGAERAQTAAHFGIDLAEPVRPTARAARPGEWLEQSPIPALFIVVLGGAFLVREFMTKGAAAAISNLNTYNFLFILAGLLLQWRPRRFVEAVARSVPAVAGVLIQFPLFGAISSILTNAKNGSGQTLSTLLGQAFAHVATHATFAPIVGLYSAVLGLFVPSGGGKWVVEAPYVMHAANELHYNLGWVVQIYNAAEALPNLINPFWMLPILGIVGLRARDLIGFTFVQFMVGLPLVLALLWILGTTLGYQAPVIPH
jgi:short-chain fatty acids transporter